MIEGEGAGKGDTYRSVITDLYRKNLDRALCTKAVIGTCKNCNSNLVQFKSEDFSETFCINPECPNHKEYKL